MSVECSVLVQEVGRFAECAIGDGELRYNLEPPPLESERGSCAQSREHHQ